MLPFLPDPDRPKNDKATILGDSVQVVKELRAEVKRLKCEQSSLLDESHDVSTYQFRSLGGLQQFAMLLLCRVLSGLCEPSNVSRQKLAPLVVCAASSRKNRASRRESSSQDRDRSTPVSTSTAVAWNATLDGHGSFSRHDESHTVPVPNACATAGISPSCKHLPTFWNPHAATSSAPSCCPLSLPFYSTSRSLHAPVCNVWCQTS